MEQFLVVGKGANSGAGGSGGGLSGIKINNEYKVISGGGGGGGG